MAAADNKSQDLPDLSGLSEEEKKQVVLVLQKAKDFEVAEEKQLMRQPLEGLLYKYTNVMKGWQYRWFVLNPESGRLEYFEKEEHKKQRPRGAVHLAGAVVSPSDEDSQTFTVNTANSEAYRLRASDARERQHWVNRLRATAEFHTENIAQNAPPLPKEARPINFGSHHSLVTNKQDGSQDSIHNTSTGNIVRSRERENGLRPRSVSVNVLVNNLGMKVHKNLTHNSSPIHSRTHKTPTVTAPTPDTFRDVKDMLHTCQDQEDELVTHIEELPNNGGHINAMDRDILLLKATSKSTLMCLEQCLHILQHQAHQTHQPHQPHHVISAPPPHGGPGGNIEWLDPHKVPINHGSRSAPTPGSPAESYVSAADLPIAMGIVEPKQIEDVGPLKHEDEVEDEEEYTDTELGGVEEHKSIILHLLSQLKLGMDLTKVVLPTFILERRSLLEMFADCMAHPDMFITIPNHSDPEKRMMAVLEWYLTSFHASRKGSVAKKPYNPIIGEKFYCSWQVDEGKRTFKGTPVHGQTNGTETSGPTGLYYCAEQVSHHPPISAFYFECPSKKMSMNASIWTKSKFMGMSIGVVMVGKVKLNLLEYDEEYQFNLPSAYARSILTVPWVELGDRVTISCPKSNYSASVIFHTKPFYGGKLHRVSAEVKNPAGEITCRVSGEWNAQLEFSYTNGQTRVVNTEKLQTMRKCVRPLEKQAENESRRMWNKVTEALRIQDIENATQHKRFLEERQRQGERMRRDTNTPFPTKLFHEVDGCWEYNKPLTRDQATTSIV